MDAVEICNMALGWVGAGRITSLSEASTLGELCRRNFGPVRDAGLEERAWRFATVRRQLAAAAADPAYGFAYQYLLPSSVVRVLEASDGAEPLLDWTREGQYVLTNQSGPIYVRSVERMDDPGTWSPGFTQAMATRLAATLAVAIAENRALHEELMARYRKLMLRSGALDGQQGRAQSTTNNWLRGSRG